MWKRLPSYFRRRRKSFIFFPRRTLHILSRTVFTLENDNSSLLPLHEHGFERKLLWDLLIDEALCCLTKKLRLENYLKNAVNIFGIDPSTPPWISLFGSLALFFFCWGTGRLLCERVFIISTSSWWPSQYFIMLDFHSIYNTKKNWFSLCPGKELYFSASEAVSLNQSH